VDGFSITVRVNGSRSVLAVAGDLDHATAHEVITATHDVLVRGVSELVVDLSNVWFVDSAGMSALVRTHLKAQALGTRMIISGVNSGVRRLLGICGLAELVDEAAE
jgi:stage II sporulation protein AA (anti-sigma F factor antagonist)